MEPLEYLEKIDFGADIRILESQFQKLGNSAQIHMIVDTPDGINISQITSIHKRLRRDEELLEIFGVEEIKAEVSSPGTSAGLSEWWQYPRHIGKKLSVYLLPDEEEGQMPKFKGILRSADEQEIVLEVSGEERTLPLAKIAKAKVLLNW